MQLTSEVLSFVVLALAVSAISMTIAKAQVFRPVRSFLRARTPFIGKMVSCPYCTSHWVAFGIAAAFPVRPVHSGVAPLDWFITALALVAAAAPVSGLIFISFRSMPEEED